MATTGNDKSAIPPKEPGHTYPIPLTGSAVAASQPTNKTPVPEYDPSIPQSYSQPLTSAPYDEPQCHRNVGESAPPKSQHSWPYHLQNVGMHSATPLNNFAAKMGSESFMPVTMDKECKKAARILCGFCSKHSPSCDDVFGKNTY